MERMRMKHIRKLISCFLFRRGPREYDMKAINLDVELPPPPHNLIIRERVNQKIMV